jgi:hypothetical protein
MECYLCAAAGRDESAVAACPHWGAGMSLAYFEQPNLGRAGMHYGCGHIDVAARLGAVRYRELAPRHEHRALRGLSSHAGKG